MSSKKQSLFSRFLFGLNIALVIVTFLAYLLPFLAPKFFPFLSVFTLVLPLFIILNALFFFFWLIQFRKKMLLSGIILLLGITFINKFYNFSAKDYVSEPSDFKLMSYNVRLFNLYQWLPQPDVPEQISRFVKEQNPDIICLQEFSPLETIHFSQYKYKYIAVEGDKNKYGQAIFSKFKIVDKGVITFPNSSNNALYCDIKKNKDTFRIYSIHLQSIKITQDIHEKIDENKSKLLVKRIGKAFAIQQHQAEMVKKHADQCPYPTLICGDMNNSAFSYVYRTLIGNRNDAFEEAGQGFGETYPYPYYPARIDYILADKKFIIKKFENFNTFNNSDHYPIQTYLQLNP